MSLVQEIFEEVTKSKTIVVSESEECLLDYGKTPLEIRDLKYHSSFPLNILSR